MALSKARNPLKTYSRQQPKAQPAKTKREEPPPKRRRIDDYFKRAPAHPSPEEKHEEEEEADSIARVPSSPTSDIPIFSDEAPISTPPSSPPPLPPSPIQRPRKPTFAFLARNGSHDKRKAPLAEKSDNVQTKPKKNQSLMQMKIDLGEETRKQCATCGMEYLPSNEEDVAIHKKFHASSVGGLDLKKAFLEQAKANRIWDNGTSTCIIAINRNDSIALRRKAVSVLDVVTSELGAVPIEEDELWSQSRIGRNEKKDMEKGNTKDVAGKPEAKGDRFKVFLYVHDNKCIGLCLAERISQAYRVLAADGNEHGQEGGSDGKSSSISVSDEADDVLMGISRIWTSRSHRRVGVAHTLLDTAVDNFLYGMEVPKTQVAFSQPTESGGILARKWFGKEHGWHVYVD